MADEPWRRGVQRDARGMSQRHSDGELEERAQALLLDPSFRSDLLRPPEVVGLGVDNLGLSGASSMPSLCEGPRVVLSTESAAALKLGHQQLIPNKLAEASRPSQRQMGSSPTGRRDSGRREVHSMPPSDLCYLDGKEPSSTLQRNRRNQSYKVATGVFTDFTNDKELLAVPTLAAVPETAAPRAARSPGRSKRTLGRKKGPRNRSSFKDDPRLYQEVRERGLGMVPESDDDLLEDTDHLGSREPNETIVVQNYRPPQMTWSQLPQVVERGILQTLSTEERKRQEAIFEIMVSEFSYQHSLNVLIDMFKNSKELQKTMTTTEHHHLFSNICDIQEASKRFFDELETRHQDDPVIKDISDIVERHATRHFDAYIVYCSNEMYQQRTLQKLLISNTQFKEVLQQIQSKPECGSLPIISFLILPMQRVTRLPLLVDTICQKTNRFQVEYDAATHALKAISKLVKSCNEGAHKMERTEQMFTIQTQLEFGKIKGFPLISTSRWLQKRGDLLTLAEESGIFSKVFGKQTCVLFLFNDVLIITRKRSEDCYAVQDYATLDQLEVEALENSDSPHSPPGKATGGSNPSSHLFKITMKKNSAGELVHMVFGSDSLSDRARWIDALLKKDDDHISKEGLQQVEITKTHLAKQPDELSLQPADVVVILQRVDGWYRGERIRDWERGWFPESCAKEITNHIAVRRNVQRMERLRIETDV